MTADQYTNEAPVEAFPSPIIEDILSQVAAGKSLVAVLESKPGYPSRTSWYRAVGSNKLFSKRYTDAVQKGVACRTYATR
jgi:hypothetical protein